MTVALVSHDAGGAEVASSFARQSCLGFVYSLAGPALRIFEKKLGAICVLQMDEAISQADWLLCGTSWQSDLECRAIELAKKSGKRSVAFLDHWANYRERFVRGHALYLPDELWVGDEIALNMARSIFPEIATTLVPNPYFLELKIELEGIPQKMRHGSNDLSVLYVCEPTSEHALRFYGNERYHGYTEHEALRYFLANLSALEKPVQNIVIRPHPAEAMNKYEWVCQEFDLPIQFGQRNPLLNEIVASDIVAGCSSMAMVVGLLAGKRVVSCIPPGGKICSLPQSEIEHLSLLIKNVGIK